MKEPLSPSCWEKFQAGAEAAGLNLRLVLTREEVERGFHAAAGGAVSAASTTSAAGAVSAGADLLAALHPDYRWAVLLGSAGRPFWRAFQRWRGAQPGSPRDEPPNPMDRFTETIVESLLEFPRGEDPAVQAAYPFGHARRLVPFLGLLQGSSLLDFTPFGVAVHPTAGPWYAWRAVVLTRMPPPVELRPAEFLTARSLPPKSVCADCEAPCVEACPAGAAGKVDFQWKKCAEHRAAGGIAGAAEKSCRATCHARLACPVGTEFRYGNRQMAFHYAASLRMIEEMLKGEKKEPQTSDTNAGTNAGTGGERGG